MRASRRPLGHAAKMYCHEGDVDINGDVVPVGGEGWYYNWYGGIHCLMGKEGYNAHLYQIRPRFEYLGLPTFGFKVAGWALVQLPSGHKDDPTDFSGKGDS